MAGTTVVFAGTLPTMKRSDAVKLAKSAGATVETTVTSKTTLLVAGRAPGENLVKAKAKCVKVVTEAAFLKLCGVGAERSTAAKRKRDSQIPSAEDDNLPHRAARREGVTTGSQRQPQFVLGARHLQSVNAAVLSSKEKLSRWFQGTCREVQSMGTTVQREVFEGFWTQIEGLQTQLEKQKSHSAKVEGEKADLEVANCELQKRVTELTRNVSAAEQQRDALEVTQTRTDKNNRELKQRVQRLTRDMEKTEELRSALDLTSKRTDRINNDLKQQVKNLMGEQQWSKTNYSMLEVRMEKAESNLAAAEKKIDSFSQQKSWSLVLQVLLAEARKVIGNSNGHHELRPTCAGNSSSKLFGAFLNGLDDWGLELGNIAGEGGNLNTNAFELAFHGTRSPESTSGIMHDGFDPAKRRRQNYGEGEYFGSFATALKFSKQGNGDGGIILVLIIKKEITRTTERPDYVIVNNPSLSTNKTYCLPFAWVAVGNTTPERTMCRRARCIPPSARLEFLNEHHKWQAVGAAVQEAFSRNVAQRKNEFTVRYQRYSYEVNLRSVEQKNNSTGRVRKLRATHWL